MYEPFTDPVDPLAVASPNTRWRQTLGAGAASQLVPNVRGGQWNVLTAATYTNNHLYWIGAPLFTSSAALEKFGVASRLNTGNGFSGDGFRAFWFGVGDVGNVIRAAIGFDGGTSTLNWVTNYNGVVVNTGIVFNVAPQNYDLRVVSDGTNVYFYLNGVIIDTRATAAVANMQGPVIYLNRGNITTDDIIAVYDAASV